MNGYVIQTLLHSLCHNTRISKNVEAFLIYFKTQAS